MNIDLLEAYPIASEAIRVYYLEILLSTLNDKNLPEDFKAHVREKGVSNADIVNVYKNSPRQLMDVFDVNGVYIEILLKMDDGNVLFGWRILPRDEDFIDIQWSGDRKEVERYAIADAFKLLNDKLCPTKS
jgi:hypothetical protein